MCQHFQDERNAMLELERRERRVMSECKQCKSDKVFHAVYPHGSWDIAVVRVCSECYFEQRRVLWVEDAKEVFSLGSDTEVTKVRVVKDGNSKV